jgi:hypothetical protein
LKFKETSPAQPKKKGPSISEFPLARPPLFPKSPKQRKITFLRFPPQKIRKKTSPKKKERRGPDAFTDAYRSVLKNPHKKTILLRRTIFDFFRFLDDI